MDTAIGRALFDGDDADTNANGLDSQISNAEGAACSSAADSGLRKTCVAAQFRCGPRTHSSFTHVTWIVCALSRAFS